MNANYLFETNRLGLRPWKDQDLASLAAMCADPEVMKFFPETLDLAQSSTLLSRLQKSYDDHRFTYFAVELKENQKFIGFAGMLNQTYDASFTPCIDIGWRFVKEAWGKGFATEAANACLDFAFQRKKIKTIYSVCAAHNKASEAIMKKIGMKYKERFFHPALKDYPELGACLVYEIQSENHA